MLYIIFFKMVEKVKENNVNFKIKKKKKRSQMNILFNT